MEVPMKNSYHKEIFDRISQKRRNKIINVAVHEFAHKGFDNANINEIASAAGISVGSIYKYFDTKEDLFLTCVHFGVETLEAVLNEVIASPGDLFLKTEKIVRIIQTHSRDQKNLIILYNEMTSESNAKLTWKLAAEMEAISARVYTSLIRQAQEAGKVKKDISPELFAFFLDNLFMMLQFSYACGYYRERFKIYAGEDIFKQDDFVVEQFMKFFRAALE
jgi:TetR/AcrR family transcriptional regulator